MKRVRCDGERGGEKVCMGRDGGRVDGVDWKGENERETERDGG